MSKSRTRAQKGSDSTGREKVEVYRLGEGARKKMHERWTFVHVAGNSTRQSSRQRYVTAWGARRAARKLYPGVEVVTLVQL